MLERKNNIFIECAPLDYNKENNILNYVHSNTEKNNYYEDLERVAIEEKEGKKRDKVRLGTDIIRNCLEMTLPMVLTSPDNLIADVGGGDGYLLSHVPVSEDNKVICDSSWTKLFQVQEDICKIRTDIEHLPLKSNFFDCVMCTEVIEHVLDEQKVLDELYRIGKSSSILIFSSPWKQDLSVLRSEEYIKKYGTYCSGHRRTLDEETINKYFSERYIILSETTIDVIQRFMEFKPYSIKLLILQKRF